MSLSGVVYSVVLQHVRDVRAARAGAGRAEGVRRAGAQGGGRGLRAPPRAQRAVQGGRLGPALARRHAGMRPSRRPFVSFSPPSFSSSSFFLLSRRNPLLIIYL